MVARLSRAVSIASKRLLTSVPTSPQASSNASKITFNSSGGNDPLSISLRASITVPPVWSRVSFRALGSSIRGAWRNPLSRSTPAPDHQVGGEIVTTRVITFGDLASQLDVLRRQIGHPGGSTPGCPTSAPAQVLRGPMGRRAPWLTLSTSTWFRCSCPRFAHRRPDLAHAGRMCTPLGVARRGVHPRATLTFGGIGLIARGGDQRGRRFRQRATLTGSTS
jgi:hypothetical protein